MQRIVLGVCAAFLIAGTAQARPAQCSTSDDGAYPCDFRATDASGSFEITGLSKPPYRLEVSEPGVAFGFVTLGGRGVALPGRFRKSSDGSGCWVNDATDAKVCAK